MKNIIDVYRSMAKVAHWTADDAGLLSLIRGPEKRPVLVNGKRLVLPTDANLNAMPGETINFHPLFEFLTRSESEIVAEFRRDIAWRFHLSFLAFASELITIAASPTVAALLTPEQSEFLSVVPDADEQMLHTFAELVDAMEEGQNQKAFCSIFLRRGGSLNGKSYHRAAIVTFPLYKQLIEDGERRDAEMAVRKQQEKNRKKDEKATTPPPENETYGVKLRAKDREAFIKLFEYMLPGIGEEHAYSAGSSSKLAPTISSLMHAAQQLGGPLNDLVERFDNRLSNTAKTILRVEDAWVPVFENLAPWQAEIKKIPPQEGNGGKVATPEQLRAEAEASVAPAQPQQQKPVNPHDTTTPQVSRPQAEQVNHAPPGFRLPDIPVHPVQHQIPPPVMMPQMTMSPTGYPMQQAVPYPMQQVPMPGMYPQHQQMPAAHPTMGRAPAGGGGPGVDFNDLFRTQPALQQAAHQMHQGMMPMGMYPQQQMQRDLPTWATHMTGTQRFAGQPQQQSQGYPTMGYPQYSTKL